MICKCPRGAEAFDLKARTLIGCYRVRMVTTEGFNPRLSEIGIAYHLLDLVVQTPMARTAYCTGGDGDVQWGVRQSSWARPKVPRKRYQDELHLGLFQVEGAIG